MYMSPNPTVLAAPAARELRYMFGVFGKFPGSGREKTVSDGGWFQETLGELHDYTVLRNDIAAKMPKVERRWQTGVN